MLARGHAGPGAGATYPSHSNAILWGGLALVLLQLWRSGVLGRIWAIIMTQNAVGAPYGAQHEKDYWNGPANSGTTTTVPGGGTHPAAH